jgi:hypothetical protein
MRYLASILDYIDNVDTSNGTGRISGLQNRALTNAKTTSLRLLARSMEGTKAIKDHFAAITHE